VGPQERPPAHVQLELDSSIRARVHFTTILVRSKMVSFESILDVVPAVGVIMALVYYTLTIRNQNRTRQAQLLMSLYEASRALAGDPAACPSVSLDESDLLTQVEGFHQGTVLRHRVFVQIRRRLLAWRQEWLVLGPGHLFGERLLGLLQ
jgi:hypothetical protein